MPERFAGSEGRRRLAEALTRQRLVGGDHQLAGALAMVTVVERKSAGTVLISQGDTSNSIYFILSGKLAILVNGRGVATRVPGEHVGEMALVDPAAARSATVTAVDDVVIGEIHEADFSKIADDYPTVWRRIAMELCARLRQRGASIRHPNDKPRLFLGSSVESLDVVREIQAGLSHDPFVTTVWTDKVFGASSFPLESLEAHIEAADFAALVFSPDDVTRSRRRQTDSPRDNVVFELGLFMGNLGRQRTLIIRQRGIDLKVPSDLLGLTVLDYPEGRAEDLPSRLGPVCHSLRQTICRLGPR